jgi:hypothetical protein
MTDNRAGVGQETKDHGKWGQKWSEERAVTRLSIRLTHLSSGSWLFPSPRSISAFESVLPQEQISSEQCKMRSQVPPSSALSHYQDLT